MTSAKPPLPAPAATRELWSHEFLDALALEQFKATARRLKAEPALINLARTNIRRWIAKTGFHAGEIRALMEWEALLHPEKLRHLLQVMTDLGEDATRMRQSSPFAGILSVEDRERITDQVINAWTRHESQ